MSIGEAARRVSGQLAGVPPDDCCGRASRARHGGVGWADRHERTSWAAHLVSVQAMMGPVGGGGGLQSNESLVRALSQQQGHSA